jgi:LmbE family N-acetylglucosaminyl deacetylase
MNSNNQRSGIRRRKHFTMAWLVSALFVLSIVVAAPVNGQLAGLPSTRNAESNNPELYQSLLDLQNPWTVMCIAAHPDDEDGATLTVLRRKYGVHTVTVFSTYGEGGQNAIGPELYEELGAIRARETIEASRIQGSEAYFLGLQDFGFSKSSAEAFRIWGHEEALRRMVLKIRQLRPDVIITNHDTLSGHGHHQATGILALEAFDAAADPRRFPEQLRGDVTAWQAQRLFVRFQFEGSGSKTAEAEAERAGKIVSIDRNERDDMRGSTYSEQALQALQQHASQGPWPQTVPANWTNKIRYRLVRSAKDAQPLPANAGTFLDGMQLPDELAVKLTSLAAQSLLRLYADKQHQSILSALVNARRAGVFATPPAGKNDEPRFRLMQERLSSALLAASGIKVTLIPQNAVLIPGTSTKVLLKVSNTGGSAARIQTINLRGLRRPRGLKLPQTIAPGESVTFEVYNFTPLTTAISVPHAEHLYDNKLFGEELSAVVNVSIDGAGFPINAATRIDVAPAVEIASISPSPFVLTPATRDVIRQPSSGTTLSISPGEPYPSKTFTLRLINHQDKIFRGEIIVGGLASKSSVRGIGVTLAPNEAREIKVQRSGNYSLIDLGGGRTRLVPNALTFSVVGADRAGIITQRKIRTVWSNALVVSNLRVGYVRSSDDTLPDALAALGVEAKELKIEDIRAGDLSGYQAIIIDNRGYQSHPELINANSRLLDYAQRGGTLIVFYHKTNEWNPDPRVNRPQLAPYPIILGNARVTDEKARVEFADPNHLLLNFPNKISQEDFEGWVQERGLYYPQSWDSHYSAPLTTNDEKETPLRGGLLAAEYGRGHYIYTSMVWYRQLRAGVPGAYRILANMISYGRNERMNARR